MSKEYWFRSKVYGYGWYPVTWQGWLITLAAALGIAANAYSISIDESVAVHVIGITCFVIMLVASCVAKGEPATWRWGK